MSYSRGPPNIHGMVSLKVDNLPYRTTTEELKRVFEKYGDVGDVYIPRHPFTKESRGFAFVRFYDDRDAEDAMDALDGHLYDGREMRVQMAKYGRPSEDRRRGGKSRSRSRSRSRNRGRRSRSTSQSKQFRSRSRSNERMRNSKSSSRSRSGSRGRDGSKRLGNDNPIQDNDERGPSGSNNRSRSRS